MSDLEDERIFLDIAWSLERFKAAVHVWKWLLKEEQWWAVTCTVTTKKDNKTLCGAHVPVFLCGMFTILLCKNIV